jgi:hypothetical protein
MRTRPMLCLAIIVAVVLVQGATAGAGDTRLVSRVPEPDGLVTTARGMRPAGVETLWIFDANFQDLTGDNAGWLSFDTSGTVGQTNYWHHDTIHLTQEYLGDSAWWCGTYDACWVQPRGYGNGWIQILTRDMAEIETTSAGDLVELEWDQRYAMEKNYDYGYVEVKAPDDSEWMTLASYTNTGFTPIPGKSHDWDHPTDGHVTLDLSSYAGDSLQLRYRFESDDLYSSQDTPDNSVHSVKDGAWQLDNITVKQNGSPLFFDGSESGNMGWVHDDIESSGQTGVSFARGRYGFDFVTGRDFTCDNRPVGSWMYAAVDPFSSVMVDDQSTELVSPPIDISGAGRLVGQWDMWVDLPQPSGDIFDLNLATSDVWECVTYSGNFIDEQPGTWYGGPYWGVWTDDWSAFAGNEWLAIKWWLGKWEFAEPSEPHRAGIFLNRQRVGVPSGDPGTVWDESIWWTFADWFRDDLTEALADSMAIRIQDDDGIVSALLVATNGVTTTSYPMALAPYYGEDWWAAPPPATEMVPGSEIHYYFEATDGVGNVSVHPSGAPAEYLEMSILPLEASVTDPGLLLVDKHGRRTPGAQRDYGLFDPAGRAYAYSEYYYREALEILGYDCETYDVRVPSGLSVDASSGPDTSGMRYYDTQIWFSNEFDACTLWPIDQWNLIQWLSQAAVGRERNLLLSGNEIGKELVGSGKETLSFYSTWLASQYVQDAVGTITVDSCPGLQDHAGGWDFLPDDGDPSTPIDWDCALQGGCPILNYFDVVDARSGIPGNEVVLDYLKLDAGILPAGVAYTHQTMGYRTVNLGFGFEFMRDGTGPGGALYTPEGYHVSGIHHRLQLMGNILEYFGRDPDSPGTGVPESDVVDALSQAHPNPFNPVTRIDYSVRDGGSVSIEIYSVAGRVVRRLLDGELEAGASGFVVWDGTNDAGERCASGVYFYRIVAPGFTASRRMVLLK